MPLRRACSTLTILLIRTHADVQPKQIGDGFIDDAEKEQLVADLQGRTGETDSEVETDLEDEHDAVVEEE